MLNVLLVQLLAALTWNRTVVPVNAREQTARGAEMLGVTLGMVQPVTAVSHLCLIRDQENGISHSYGITWVSYDACKDIGILRFRDKETLS